MSKYKIERKENEVIFKKFNIEVAEEENLVELTESELDKQFQEYTRQDIYISVYHQEQTRNGIKFVRSRHTVDESGNYKYKFKPSEDEEFRKSRELYGIIIRLFDVDIFKAKGDEPVSENIFQYLNKEEYINTIKDFLSKGYNVNLGHYEYKWRRWRFIMSDEVKEVTKDGKILYK